MSRQSYLIPRRTFLRGIEGSTGFAIVGYHVAGGRLRQRRSRQPGRVT